MTSTPEKVLSVKELVDDGDFDQQSYALVAPSKSNTEATLRALASTHGVNRWRLQLKIDICLVVPICILYIMAFLDRINIGNARVYGMDKDLNLNDMQWAVALTVFFVPYILFEIPSNYFLKRLNPHIWLSGCMFGFGAACLAQGFVKNYAGLIATRTFLGVAEAGMFPGCFYLISCWYRREEAQKRYSFFVGSTCLAGAFSGLIAYGMDTLHMKQGLESWRWLFIIEGAITCAIAIILYFCIVDFPEDAMILRQNEREYMVQKLALDVGDSQHNEKVKIRHILAVFKEWKVWVAGVMYFNIIVPSYGYAYFAPSIISTFGYSVVKTQVHSIFPWLTTFIVSMIFASLSDRYSHRYLFTIVSYALALLGIAILIGTNTDQSGIRYGAMYLVVIGCYSGVPTIVGWCNGNSAGHARKAVISGYQVGFGNIGGIVATFLYPKKESPAYKTGLGVSMAFVCFGILCNTGYLLGIMYENRQRRSGKAQIKFDAKTPREKEWAGDLDPKFTYTY